MNQYELSDEEDMQLRLSVMLPNRRSLYEYLCELPLEDLKAYPKKGYHWWMGRAARSPKALTLREYILYWRFAALDFRKEHSKEHLEKLPHNDLRLFLRIYIKKTPLWVYEEPIRDVLQLLYQHSEST